MYTLLNSASKLNKQNIISDPLKQLHRLKIQLNDKTFQLRKLQQDHAEDKAKFYIEMQKQKQSNSRTQLQYKNRIKQDNQSWSLKMDQVKQQYNQNLQRIKAENISLIKDQIDRNVEVIKEKYEGRIKQLADEIKELQGTLKKERIFFNEQKHSIQQKLALKYEKVEQEQLQRHHILIKEIKRQNDGKIAALEKIYVKQEAKYTKIKEQFQNYVAMSVRQKIKAEQTQRSFISDIEATNIKISELNLQVKKLQETLLSTKLAHLEEIQRLKEGQNIQISVLKQNFSSRETSLVSNYDNGLQKMRLQIDGLIKIHKNKEDIWQQRGKKVLQLFQKRQSKREDVKAIQKLQIQLIKRDFMIQKQRKQLKNCRLEIQNMQQIYDRIFIANSNLNRIKSKNYHIRKYRNTNILNESNRSTILSEKKHIDDK